MALFYVLQGPITSRWAKFVKQLKLSYSGNVCLTTSLSAKSHTPLLAPIELISSPADLPNSSDLYIYISSSYQLDDISKLMSCMSGEPTLIAASADLAAQLFERTGRTADSVIPLNAEDRKWRAVFSGKCTRAEIGVDDGHAILGGSPTSILGTSETVVVKPSYGEINFPTSKRYKSTVRRELDLGDVVYSANSTYQLEHILPLMRIMPGAALIPIKQFRLLSETDLLKQYPDIASLSSPVMSVGYPGEFTRLIRNRFLITTGSFRQLSSMDYPDSLFVCHGISDKLGYHAGAARAGFRYYASSGPRFTWMYTKHGVPENRIIKCGYLRVGITPPAFPAFDVLYAPTHRAGTILPYVDGIVNACHRQGLSLKIRLHPLTEPHIVQQIKRTIMPFLVPGTVSTWALLKAARHVITDISSISYEALLWDKPMLLLDGAAGWTKLEHLPSGKFGLVVRYEQQHEIGTYIRRLMQGESTSSVSKEDVFYLNPNPADVVRNFIQEHLR